MDIITNAHTHLELTALAGTCPTRPAYFVNWAAGVGWRLSRLPREALLAGVARGIDELLACGTTQVGDISHSWLSVEPLLKSGLRGIAYLEVLGNGSRHALERLGDAQVEINRLRRDPRHGPMQVGLSLHAPYSCHPELLRAGATWCRSEHVPLCIHVAESVAETELLLYGMVPALGRPGAQLARLAGLIPQSIPHMRPVAYLASLGVLEARPLLAHAVHVTDDDIRLIADCGCAVVHCPRSNHLLSCGRMPLERFLAAAVTVYLGTDSRASSPDLDVRAEAEFATRLHSELVAACQVTELLHRPLDARP